MAAPDSTSESMPDVPLLQPEPSNSAFASYVPHDLQYNAEFEDSLADLILAAEPAEYVREDEEEEPSLLALLQKRSQDGIVVISPEEEENAVHVTDNSVRAQDVATRYQLPTFTEDELPLRLDDSRRIFASRIPGIRLTHPGGYFEGGPGLDPDMDTFSEDFLAHHADIRTVPELRAAIDTEIKASLELLRERLRARRRAQMRNEQIEKDLKLMSDEHSMELKINKKLADERRAKKEAKERRRLDREAG